MSKIYDLVQFNGENELLEIRLETLKDVVDVFVIGSCGYSHSGIWKGVNEIPAKLLEKFKDKIVFIEIPYIPSHDPFVNEHNGRDYIYNQMETKIKSSDLLLVCDLDEIPSPDILKEQSQKLNTPITFCGDYYMFCLNLWGRKSIDGFLINNMWKRGSLNHFRSHRTNWTFKDGFKHIPDSSWHFSSVGSPEWIAKKMSYFCHANEFNNQTRNPDYIRELIKNKCGDFDINKPGILQEYPIEKMPKYIQENRGKFKHLFYESYK